MMSKESTYQINIKNAELEVVTTSFRAENGSVLHSGIYNREMASSLAAGACLVLAGFYLAAHYTVTAVHFVAALFFFIPLFFIFRTLVFRETVLYVVINRSTGKIILTLRRGLGEKKIEYPLSELDTVRQDYLTVAPENPDGIKLVEKIALQHGTVIPGFGETAEFYTVELEFRDGKRILIFSSKNPAEADEIATKINNYIER